MRASDEPRKNRHVRVWLGTLALASLLLMAMALPGLARAAGCPQGNFGVLPLTLDGVEIHPYSSENIAQTFPDPAIQKNCVVLYATGTAPSPLQVNLYFEDVGLGVEGPWPIDATMTTSINLSGGDPVVCTTTANVAHIEPLSGSLPVGSFTDVCCFVWEAAPGDACSDLPDVGDTVRAIVVGGSNGLMPLITYIPTGGTTCGLVGLEAVLALVGLRIVRRRRS